MFNMSIKEWTISAVSTVLIIAMTLFSGGLKVRSHVPEISESYEMKRTESSFFSRFDLSGREDNLEIIGQEARKQAAAKAATTPPVADKPKVAVVDPKKKAKEEAAKKKAQAEAARKAKLSVAVVGDSRTGLSYSVTGTVGAMDGKYSNTVLFAPKQANNQRSAKDTAQQEDPQLSAGQWLSLLQNQPSNENAIAFRKAKTQIGNKAYYYDVLAKLLVDSQADRQAFAYNLIKGDVSSETFYFISNPTEEIKKHDSVYQKLTALYDLYKSKNQFGILSYALSIENANSNLAALAIVKELYTKIQTQSNATAASAVSVTTGAPTPTTAGTVSTLKVDDLKVFEKLVLKLEASTNQVVVENAKSIHGVLWSATAVASNGSN